MHNPFSDIVGTPAKNIPPLEGSGDNDKASDVSESRACKRRCLLHFPQAATVPVTVAVTENIEISAVTHLSDHTLVKNEDFQKGPRKRQKRGYCTSVIDGKR